MTTDTSQKLHVNDHIGDFVVTGIEKLPEISGTAFVFSHVPSGARLLWLANDDENRSFALSTPYCADQKPTRLKSHL